MSKLKILKSSVFAFVTLCALVDSGPAKANPQSGYLINLGTPLAGIGQSLESHGIYISGNDTNELFNTVAGGLKHGAVGGGQADLSTTLDMGRLAGIPGGQVHVTLDYQYGALATMPGGYTGATLIASGIQGPGVGDEGTIRLAELSWSQSFMNKRLEILAGRMQSTWFFNLQPLLLQFESTNVVLGSPTFVFDTNGAGYPEATWGGLVRFEPTSNSVLKVGLFEDNNSLAYPNTHDLPGVDWSLQNSNGVLVPVQLGVSPTLGGMPGTYQIGGYYDSSYYTAPFFSSMQRGRTGIYIHAQQKIWAPSSGSHRGLILFGQASWATSGVNAVQNAFAAGAVDNGPFALRPHDSVGILATFEQFGGAEERYLDTLIAQQGGHGNLRNHETAFEAEYTLALAPGMSFRPFVQYIINPDQVFSGNPNPDLRTATVVGANLFINFNSLLGLPQAPLTTFRP